MLFPQEDKYIIIIYEKFKNQIFFKKNKTLKVSSVMTL